MKSKTFIVAGAIALTSATAEASVRLNNPNWNHSQAMSVDFTWQINASSGPTSETEPGFIEGVEDYVDVEDQSCGCPDGYTPPCYMVADAGSANWEPW